MKILIILFFVFGLAELHSLSLNLDDLDEYKCKTVTYGCNAVNFCCVEVYENDVSTRIKCNMIKTDFICNEFNKEISKIIE